MKKVLKIALIIIVCIIILAVIVGVIASGGINSVANADEYKIGNDTISSIKAVVEERNVTAVSTETSNGITTQTIEYESDTVQEDISKYVEYLRAEGGFLLTEDADLSQVPSTVQLGKESNDSGQIIRMTINYDASSYTIIIQKGKGSVTAY